MNRLDTHCDALGASFVTHGENLHAYDSVTQKSRKTTVVFNNTIRSHGVCGPASDQSGFYQYLINRDREHRYRVTVVSTWENSRTKQIERYTKIYTCEAGSETELGCNYKHVAGNGLTRITRKITREVQLPDEP